MVEKKVYLIYSFSFNLEESLNTPLAHREWFQERAELLTLASAGDREGRLTNSPCEPYLILEPRPKRVDALFIVDVDMRYIRGDIDYKSPILLLANLYSLALLHMMKESSKLFFS